MSSGRARLTAAGPSDGPGAGRTTAPERGLASLAQDEVLWRVRAQQARDRVARAEKSVADIEKEADLEDEARRAGALPGWLR